MGVGEKGWVEEGGRRILCRRFVQRCARRSVMMLSVPISEAKGIYIQTGPLPSVIDGSVGMSRPCGPSAPPGGVIHGSVEIPRPRAAPSTCHTGRSFTYK